MLKKCGSGSLGFSKMDPVRRQFSRTFFFLFLCFLNFSILVRGQVLTPPYFNLAQGRRIEATATCGEGVPEPELYCKLVGRDIETENKFEQLNVIQGQFCDHCDPNNDEKKHPAEYAVDGRETRWQSPPLSRGMSYNQVNLTIELGQEFHVAYVIVKMGNSPRPGVWALERSNDNGKTFQPWQYFADTPGECQNFFGSHVNFKIEADDTVICTTEFSKIVPLEGGEIVVPLVQGRPSANDFFNSTILQEWTRATDVRFRLLRVKNLLGHLMSIANQDTTTTRRYFYAIKDISIGGRCRCNGHADTCTSVDQNDPYRLVCDCKDHTCGNNCETCCPGFEQKKWSQSKSNRKFVCEPCNCFGHTDQCVYNETIDNLRLSLDIHGNYEGGGVCQNCQHNTEGVNCDKCRHGYFRPLSKNLNDTDVCQKCQCDHHFSTGNCEDGSGRCECKPEYTKPDCRSCSYGHFGYPVCRPCGCFLNGSLTSKCEPENGKCDCKMNFGGQFCKHCADGYFNFSVCEPCKCHPLGSSSNICDLTTGECKCKNSFGNKNCDQCSDGYHSFPSCYYCDCDVKGTVGEICDKNNGQCLCKPGYGGARCDQCISGFTGFPNCKPCNCSSIGSPSESCDNNGKCVCHPHFGGKQCDQCSPGFYQYPNCTACNCDPYGNQGSACKDDGTCVCRDNFEGEKCTECKKGYYNYPTCEKCTYNPSGVISNFTGCSAFQKPGDLKTILCKRNVQGRECSDCKELFWNLQRWNPDGCEDCNCNLNGTTGEVATCSPHSGQCSCKPFVQSRQCDQCMDGHYNLKSGNLFGCQECDCDIGGSMSQTCNKATGHCNCLPRVDGRTCKQPTALHYFPTLHQYQFEIEEGRTPTTRISLRYGYDEKIFPDYSWKGYGIFSNLQNETLHEVFIDKPSVYRMILRYINPNNIAISGIISVVPDTASTLDAEQKFQVLLKPSASPAFITVAGISGNNPSPFVLNPGLWIVKIKIEKSVFLDYFVLIPAEYYEASLLVSNITSPCTIDEEKVCRHYLYPNISSFDYTRGAGGYLKDGDSRSPPQYYFEDYQESFDIPKMPLLSDSQPELHVELRVSRLGPHVFVLVYATTKEFERNLIKLEVVTPKSGNGGVIPINNCRYTSLCRQVVLDDQGRNGTFDLDSNFVSLILKFRGSGKGVGIDSIIAIPSEEWSLGYIQPKPACLMKDKTCTSTTYRTPPDSKKIDFKSGNEQLIAESLPTTILDNTTELVIIDSDNPMVDLRGKVPKPGPYIFVVHYYQPDFPEFDADILIQDGIFYEAKILAQHCPSNIGCRAVVKQANGNMQFQLPENFVFSVKKPGNKYLWLHYLLVIPSSQYSDQLLTESPYDQTAMFIAQCGHNNFYLNTNEEGFCKDATFSLTTKYNHGTLTCSCDSQGATSFVCEAFGGQCPCKSNVIGRRCDSCKMGYFNFPDCQPCNCPSTAPCDPYTGECICPPNVIGEKCNMCKPNTYGLDPNIGCPECQCNPYGTKNRNMQCDLQTGLCDCKEDIEGRTCDRCIAGHWKFPDCANCECDLRGTTEEICNQDNANCMCKTHVHGEACDICNDGTFNLQADNEEGCTKCFCFGKTSRCSSAGHLYISSVSSFDNWTIATLNINKSIEVTNLPVKVEKTGGGVEVNLDYVIQEGVSYFVAPEPYLGNKLTSYGSHLNYTLHYMAAPDGDAVGGHDVILYGANMYLLYESIDAPSLAMYFPVSVKIVESNFMTVSGSIVTREELMQVLRNLTAIYIKATYSSKPETVKILTVTLEIAEIATAGYDQYSNINNALAVEQCRCPPNYVGLSCEECADGFYRVSTGPFGGYCVPCQCNGHAATCDKVTGVCINCEHNTRGDHCEKCETKYYGNATIGTPTDCLICACPLPVPSNNFASECVINEYGDKIICKCEPGYTGDLCERCAPGFFGRPEIQGQKCSPCQCNDNVNLSEPGSCDHVNGRCLKCLNNTYGSSCERCAPGYYGDAIVAKNCQACDCDTCGTKECNHMTGQCTCHENVVGEKCDRCTDNHFGFTTCQGCAPCDCQSASESKQCDDLTGFCRCKPGVIGQLCDRCSPGYWKYTADGCTSCGCKTEYSVGVGCNVDTGECECLPGVIGDKCNECPYRWVLLPGEGCMGCDKCTDGLLDVTDAMRADFEPLFNRFQSASIAYFTVQRLKFINNTADEYAPNVTDVMAHQFDLSPYDLLVSLVETEAENTRRSAQLIYSTAFEAAHRGGLTYEMANDLEKMIAKVIDNAKMSVFEMERLVFSFATGTVNQINYAVKEAEGTLSRINDFDLDVEKRTAVEETLDKAKNVSTLVTDFSQPLNNTGLKLMDVKGKHEILNKKLDEVDKYVEKAQDSVKNAVGGSQSEKKMKVMERLDNLKNMTVDIDKSLANLPEMTKNTTGMVEDAKKSLDQLIKSKEALIDRQKEADKNLESLLDELRKAHDEAKKAEKHAEEISTQAKVLESTAEHQVSHNQALDAANSYSVIATAVEEALQNLTSAKADVDLAIQKSDGLIEKIQQSSSSSVVAHDNAMGTLTIIQKDLNTVVQNFEEQQRSIHNSFNVTKAKFENILKQLKNLQENQVKPSDQLERLNVDAINAQSTKSSEEIKHIFDNAPKKLKEAKQVYLDLNLEKNNIEGAISFASQLSEKIPNLEEKINKIHEKPLKFDEMGISARLDELRTELTRARGTASKIKVGVTLSPRTSLQLPLPAKLLNQSSSTDLSLYFKAYQPNALLLYMGNDATSVGDNDDTLRKPKTDDFLALMLSNGYPQLKVNLGGSNNVESVTIDEPVNANEWYHVRVKRIGKLLNFTIRNSKEVEYWKSGKVHGFHSVFNLDKEHSKFYIGGIPDSFRPPEAIQSTTFSGQFEDLVVNGEQIGLWNFEEVLVPAGTPISAAITGTEERDKLKVNQTSTACRFDGETYLKLPAGLYSGVEDTTIIMSFKTTAQDGLLYLTFKDQYFITLEMRSGFIQFRYNLGKGSKLLQSKEQYNDGEWHTVEAARVGNRGRLSVDRKLIAEDGSKEDVSFELPTNVYVGGFEGMHKFSDVVKTNFEGCLDYLQLQSSVVKIRDSVFANKVLPECQEKFPNLLSFQEGYRGFVSWPDPRLNITWKTTPFIELTMGIKTKAKNASIAYGTDGIQTFFLQLVNGALLFKRGNHEVKSSPNVKYNDDNWHTILATLGKEKLHLIVDDFDVSESQPVPNPVPFGTSGRVYFGTVPSDVDSTVAYESPFWGCISDVTFNDVVVNFENVAEGIDAAIGRCSGPGKNIPLRSPRPFLNQTSVTETPLQMNETTEPVTVAPGSLPLVPAIDPDLNSDSGSRFGTTKNSVSIYDFDASQISGQFELSLDLKTTKTDGIIFYVTSRPKSDDFIALYIKDSQVRLKYQCGAVSNVLSVPMNSQAEWQTLAVKINTLEAQIINNKEKASSDGGCDSIDLHSPYYVGGVEETSTLENIKADFEGVNKIFVGCIRNFIATAQSVQEPRKVGVIPCSTKTEEGTFFSANGYIKLSEAFKVERGIDIKMEIKPRNISGLIMAVHSKRDFLVLQMVDGSIKFTLDSGNGPITASFPPPSPYYFLDKKFHTVIASKVKNVIMLTVDSKKPQFAMEKGDSLVTDTNNPLFIGGYPPTLAASKGIETSAHFIGCIKNLELNKKSIDLSMFPAFGDVIFNVCPTI